MACLWGAVDIAAAKSLEGTCWKGLRCIGHEERPWAASETKQCDALPSTELYVMVM